MQAIVEYFKGVFNELKKVSWPTRKEAIRFTIAIIFISLIFAAFIGILDMIFTYLLQKILGA